MQNIIQNLKRSFYGQLRSVYIAGPNVSHAVRVCRQVAEKGWSSTICPWDGPDDHAELVASSYEHALTWISKEGLDCYLSIKPPALNFDFARFRPLLLVAKRAGIRLHFDSYQFEYADPCFAMFEDCLAEYQNVSCTLPARWLRSLSDAERVIDYAVPVRVVKGQWADPDHPRLEPGQPFLKIVDTLAGRVPHVAVATHNKRLARESLLRLQESGTSCELEQLFGLPLHTVRIAEDLGVPVRLYIPYGYAWLPYSLAQIRKRPIIFTWLVRDMLGGTTKKILN